MGSHLETGRKVCTERDQIIQNPGGYWWVRALREIRKDCSISRKMLQRIALLTVALRIGSFWEMRVSYEDKCHHPRKAHGHVTLGWQCGESEK